MTNDKNKTKISSKFAPKKSVGKNEPIVPKKSRVITKGDFSKFIQKPKEEPLPFIEESRKKERKPKTKIELAPKPKVIAKPTPPISKEPTITRLNKFVAQSGLCARRKAAELVKEGLVKVNGHVEKNPAYEVQDTDKIYFEGKLLTKKTNYVYLLMNKPKNTITSLNDELGRKTVLDLLKDKTTERVFPVGRLDRNTTGLLLLTNDGDLAEKLSHPSHKIKKFYHAVLDKPMKMSDMELVRKGLTLEDGLAEVDSIQYIKNADHTEVGLEIHIGKNRIVRRIFEFLGYVVEKLDRTYYAGLTKKDLPRGFSRPLTEQEVIMLKHFT